jgi:3-phosphoglycerate kinase
MTLEKKLPKNNEMLGFHPIRHLKKGYLTKLDIVVIGGIINLTFLCAAGYLGYKLVSNYNSPQIEQSVSTNQNQIDKER